MAEVEVQKRPARRGRKRWGPLIRFLTNQMQTAGSERVRMEAARRLCDILSLREERELIDLRREDRAARKAAAGGVPEPSGPSEVETAELAADRFLASLRERAIETKETDE